MVRQTPGILAEEEISSFFFASGRIMAWFSVERQTPGITLSEGASFRDFAAFWMVLAEVLQTPGITAGRDEALSEAGEASCARRSTDLQIPGVFSGGRSSASGT